MTLTTNSSNLENRKCAEVEVEEEIDEPCLTCHIVDWATFKAGVNS